MRIVVVIPAFNEELTVAQTIRDFHAVSPKARICVVDNHSTDRTSQVVRDVLSELRDCEGMLLSESRRGKSYAIRRAFMDVDADVYVMVDADSTYAAGDLPKLLAPVLSGDADMAVGDRHGSGDYRRENVRPFHDFGNRLVKNMINRLFSTNLNDILSGYRVFTRQFVKSLPILSTGFELETAITLHALDCKFRVIEIPVSYRNRPTGSASKLNTFSDALRVLWEIFEILRYNRPLFFFGTLASMAFVSGLAVGAIPIVEFCRTGLILHMPSAVLATGLVLCGFITLAIALVLDMIARNNRQIFQLRLLDLSARLSRDT
jgi:glycosyltransferase involved in cell wall biosynthesis